MGATVGYRSLPLVQGSLTNTQTSYSNGRPGPTSGFANWRYQTRAIDLTGLTAGLSLSYAF